MIRVFMIGYSNNKGGVESYIVNLCKNLDPSKYDVILSMPEMNIDGKKWIRPANRHNYFKYYKFWKRFFKENHFDVLYFNTCDVVSIDELKFAKAAGIPVRIIHSHSTGNQQGVQQRMSLFHRVSEKHSRKTLDKYATHLFACSEAAGDWMFDGRPYLVIKNGIKLSEYQFNNIKRIQMREKFGYNDEFLIGIIGRLAPAKNPLFAVKILQKLLMNKGVKAVFIGDGEQRQEVKSAIDQAGLEQKVKLVGSVDNVNEWMSAIDCLLMPSLFEGLPFVLIEAQVASLPCIVSSAVSMEANITGNIEYISLEENVDVWVNKILHVSKKDRQDNIHLLVDAGYSIEDTARVVSEIIENSL